MITARILRPFRYAAMALAILFATQAVQAADSTSFDPTTITVQAETSGGIPVNGVIPWDTPTIPDGYLECNGQTFNTTAYPELYRIRGVDTVPDYRGQFLRGIDHGKGIDTGRVLGSEQGDAIRNITGKITNNGGGREQFIADDYSLSGAFYGSNPVYSSDSDSSSHNHTIYHNVVFDASRVVPTANENRPRNIAVMYIIRAK